MWSNAANACVAGTSLFQAPTADFTATPAQNTAAFQASGSSTNHLGAIAAGIVESAHAAKKHRAKSHKLVVGSATLTVSPGATAKLTFKLNGLGKRLLKTQGHLLVTLTVTVRHGSDAPVVFTRTLHISAPKKHRHK